MSTLANVSYCKVVGKFHIFVSESGGLVPMNGDGLITPQIMVVQNVEEGSKSHIYIDPIPVQVDADGDLSQGDHKYVMLVVPEYPIVPEDFKYSITLYLSAPDTTFVPVTYGPMTFSVIKNGVVDLSDL